MGGRGSENKPGFLGRAGPALGSFAVLALVSILVPATGWGDNCSSCHTNASRLQGLVSPPLPSPEDEGEG